MATEPVFRRDSERDAYRLLHEQGFDALVDAHGTGVAYDLINRWHDKGLARITGTVGGGFKVRTFKKYAK